MASEFDTIAELRESLTDQVKQKGAFAQGSEARDKLVEQLLEAADIAVPEALVEDEVHRHLEQENRLEDDTHRAEVKEASEKQFRTQLLFDRIAKDLEVQVSQDEFTQYLIQASSQYGMSPQDFIQALQQGNQLQAIMGDVARNKAIAVVLGKAEVVDTNGDAVDLEGFVAVEEAEEPEAEESAEDEK
jgi:trigger factor